MNAPTGAGSDAAAVAASRVARIRALLEQRLAPVRLEIRDESAAHAGHAGAAGGAGHFRVIVVSDAFRGRSLVQRHRLVHDALAQMLKNEIHALALVTKAPEELV
jgi:BolA family transcriptional regulator, general stress-responsive regulator